MKCPECGYGQKYKFGMICSSCKYQFAIDPKASPLTDFAVKKTIDRITGLDQYYFTYFQLFSALYRLIEKKKTLNMVVIFIFSLGFTIIGYFVSLSIAPGMKSVFTALIFICCMILFLWIRQRPLNLSFNDIDSLIQAYTKAHPQEKMVTETAFEVNGHKNYLKEILKHAPEQVLITQRHDMANMLILNRFHTEHKTLILSANMQPAYIFKAYQQIIKKFPDTRILLIHDASKEGIQLKSTLLKQTKWALDGKTIIDLGLHYSHIKNLEKPIWIPDLATSNIILTRGVTEDNIKKGYRIPVDQTFPRIFMEHLTLAIGIGAPLFSDDFMKEAIGDNGSVLPGYG